MDLLEQHILLSVFKKEILFLKRQPEWVSLYKTNVSFKFEVNKRFIRFGLLPYFAHSEINVKFDGIATSSLFGDVQKLGIRLSTINLILKVINCTTCIFVYIH